MAIQTINLGSYANDGSGDDLRTAFNKVNANFALLGTDIPLAEGANLGTNTITVTRFLTKSGTAPYSVTFVIATQGTIPPIDQYYYVSGNTNPLYNGHWFCTASTTSSVTLSYPADPGVFGTADGTVVSLGVGVYKSKNTNIAEFKSLTSSDNSISISATANNIDIRSGAGLINDPNPTLGGNLNINGNTVIDTVGTGDLQTTVYGIRVDVLNSIFALMLQTNSFNIDMGTIAGATNSIDLDMGFITAGLGPLVNNTLDFGQF
jgi:hypothetical protein